MSTTQVTNWKCDRCKKIRFRQSECNCRPFEIRIPEYSGDDWCDAWHTDEETLAEEFVEEHCDMACEYEQVMGEGILVEVRNKEHLDTVEEIRQYLVHGEAVVQYTAQRKEP